MIQKNCYKYVYFAHILDYFSDLQKNMKFYIFYIYKILFEVILFYNYNDKFLFQVVCVLSRMLTMRKMGCEVLMGWKLSAILLHALASHRVARCRALSIMDGQYDA